MSDQLDTSGNNPTDAPRQGAAGAGSFLPAGHVVQGRFEIVRPLGNLITNGNDLSLQRRRMIQIVEQSLHPEIRKIEMIPSQARVF